MLPILDQPLDYKCLALTGSLETSSGAPDCFACVSGDFDGQGMSFGALQWNLGQGTLQPLLLKVEEALDSRYADLWVVLRSPRADQLAWARSIQDSRHHLVEPWRELFRELGHRPEFQEVQRAAAGGIYTSAQKLCATYGLRSERATALMFDIRVQNGGISQSVKAQIERDIQQLAPSESEVALLRIIANRRAEAANPRWIEDVRTRKLTIANGEGTVHGRHYNLEAQFGISLQPVVV